MPTKRTTRTPRPRATAELDFNLEEELRSGAPWFTGCGFPSPQEMALAWQIHGRRITEEYIAENPGRRPFGWWYFVGVPKYGEPPLVSTHPAHYKRREDIPADSLLLRHGILIQFEPLQENETDFLYRHGELKAAEIAALEGEPGG
jgi:hypothetical protein